MSDVLRAFVSGPVADRLVQDALVEDRRTVTAVFADLSGFTALAGSLEPTELARVIDPVVAGLTRIVDRYGGAVEKFAGDAILAFFGAPIAHEDDAQRALLAALEMHEQLPLLSSHPAAQTLTLHVGVNTGEVYARMVGSQARLDYAVLGEAVVLAQRLESLAPNTQTYVGAETAALVGDAFLFEDLGALAVKGRAEPVQAVRLLGRSLAPRATRRRSVAFVGRERELDLVQDRHRRRRSRGRWVAVVCGDAGLGKSALVEAVGNDARAAGLRTLTLRSLSHGVATPFLPVVDALRADLEADPEDPALRSLLGLAEAEDSDLPTAPEALRAALTHAAAAWLLTCAQASGLLLVAEDLHWADAATVDVLEEVGRVASAQRILLLATSRPGSPAIRALADATGTALRLDLEPFGPEHLAALLENELGAPPDARVVGLLASRTEGNPLFAAELGDALAEDGTLVLRDGRWRLAAHAETADIPRSVGALFGARVDALAPLLAETLWAAAIVGMEPEPALVARTLDLPEDVADERLGRLVTNGLLRVGAGPRAFRHALLRDAVLERLAPERARALHLRVAEALAQAAPPGTETSARIGAHLFDGGSPRLALPYLVDVATLSRAVYAHAEAIEVLARACRAAAVPPVDPSLVALLLQLADSAEAVGDYAAAGARFAEAAEWAETLEDTGSLVAAWTGRGAVQRRAGGYEAALTVLDAGLAAARPYGADLRPLLLERARTLEVLGRQEEAWATTEEGLDALPDGMAADGPQARLLLQRAGMHTANASLDEARSDLAAALAIFSAADDAAGVVGGLTLLGEVYERAGAFDDAADAYRRAYAEAVRISRVEDAAGVLNNVGLLALATEDWPAARDAFAAAGEQFAQVGHRAGVATCRANEAYARWRLDDLETARALAEQAIIEADAIGRAFASSDARLTAGLSLVLRATRVAPWTWPSRPSGWPPTPGSTSWQARHVTCSTSWARHHFECPGHS